MTAPERITIKGLAADLDSLGEEIRVLQGGDSHPAARGVLAPIRDAITAAFRDTLTLQDEARIASERSTITKAEAEIARAQARIEERRKGDPS